MYVELWHRIAYWLFINRSAWRGIDQENIPGLSDQIVALVFKQLARENSQDE